MATPLLAFAWSVSLLVGAIFASGFVQQVMLCGFGIAAVAAANRSLRPVLQGIALTLPVAAILVAVHGCLSPLFPVSGQAFGWVPIRMDGIEYALQIVGVILVVTLAALVWRGVSRSDLIDDLIWIRAPIVLIAIVGQTLSAIEMLRRKVSLVFLAQEARGVPVSGSFAKRLLALPSVMVPVVVATLVEAESRSQLLTSRGFGDGRLSIFTRRRLTLVEMTASLLLPFAIGILLVAVR